MADVELWLVRHGETERSRDGILAGWADIPLTARGEEQARSLRPLLADNGFASAWSSDLQRTARTAALAWGEAPPEPRLREANFGHLEGVPWRALPPSVLGPIDAFRGFAFPGGETEAVVWSRVCGFVSSLPAGRHLLFTHGGVIRLLTREAGLDEFLPTASVAVMTWPGRRLLAVHRAGGN